MSTAPDADVDLPAGAETESRSETLLRAQKHSLEMVASGAPLPEILSFLVGVVEDQAAHEVVGSILLLDEAGKLWTGAAPSLPDAYNSAIDGLVASADLGTCSVAAVTGRTVITRDFETDPNWAALKSLPLGLGLKSAWSQPITARDGQVLGTFGTYFRECRAPSSFERRLVEALAQTAAVAIERKRADEAAETQRRILDLALEAAEMGSWRYTMADHVCVFGVRAQRLYGLEAARYVHDEAGVRDLIHPDDIEAMWTAVAAACDPAGAGRYAVEYRTRRPEGGWRWLSVWGMVEFEPVEGGRQAVAITGASRDISDRKLAEERQRLLVNELNHRVKNTLATIQSLTRQTLASAPSPAQARARLEDRLHSLARAHDVLTAENWSGADLSEIVQRALEPFDPQGGRIDMTGPVVRLAPKQALAISMALHELATNATKYGGLSCGEGRVRLAWSVGGGEDAAPRLALSWRETGGPAVRAPERRGFGTRLLEAGLAHELGGSARFRYAPEGLIYEAEVGL